MPITKSAKKALRQNKRRREQNVKKLNALRAEIKAFKKLTLANKKDEAKTALPKVYKLLDKAVKTNLIKKNTASRTKSRLTKSLTKIAP